MSNGEPTTATIEASPANLPATTPQSSNPPSHWITFWQSATTLLTSAIETFGWPGTLLICGFFFVIWYATPEQKQSIIDVYVLGKDIGFTWPLLLVSGVFVATAFAQHRLYEKKLSLKNAEIDRISDEKSRIQEKLLGKELPHAKSKIGKKGK